MLNFRDFHLLQILEGFEAHPIPLDLFLRNYFKDHKAVGAKDRKEICLKLYQLIRWKGLVDHFCQYPTWERRLLQLAEIMEKQPTLGNDIEAHIRVSFPKWYFDTLQASYGEARAIELCLASNMEAPTTIRVNTLKISRDELFTRWENLYPIRRCEQSPNGIVFAQRVNFFGLPEFKEGFFEVQDEASQLAANLLPIKPGNLVLDYCSGSGGKTLAFAPRMEGKGQIYLHDIREHALVEAKKRLKRAGIQNAQVILNTSPNLKALKHKMDVILVDAPCSGSGTLRRNPDMKWKFQKENLDNLIKEQREIMAKAMSFARKGATIIYATCSLFPEENEQQVEFFLKTLPLKLQGTPFQSFPEMGKMDGFFAATFLYEKI